MKTVVVRNIEQCNGSPVAWLWSIVRSELARHFRDRKVLLYYEKERKKVQRQMGQDPYLDTAG